MAAFSGRRRLVRIIEPIAGPAAHHHPGAADLRLRRADPRAARWAATTSVSPTAPAFA